MAIPRDIPGTTDSGSESGDSGSESSSDDVEDVARGRRRARRRMRQTWGTDSTSDNSTADTDNDGSGNDSETGGSSGNGGGSDPSPGGRGIPDDVYSPPSVPNEDPAGEGGGQGGNGAGETGNSDPSPGGRGIPDDVYTPPSVPNDAGGNGNTGSSGSGGGSSGGSEVSGGEAPEEPTQYPDDPISDPIERSEVSTEAEAKQFVRQRVQQQNEWADPGEDFQVVKRNGQFIPEYTERGEEVARLNEAERQVKQQYPNLQYADDFTVGLTENDQPEVTFTRSGRKEVIDTQQELRAGAAAATSGSGELARGTSVTDFEGIQDEIEAIRQKIKSQNPGLEGDDFTVGISDSGAFTVDPASGPGDGTQSPSTGADVDDPPGTPRSRAGATGSTGDNLPDSGGNVTGLAGVLGLDAQTVRNINEASENVLSTVFTGDGYGDSGLPGPELSVPGGDGALFGTTTSKDTGSVNTDVTDALTRSGGFLTEGQEQDLRMRANRLSNEYAFIGNTLEDTVGGVTGSEKAGRFAGSFGDVVGNLPANIDRGILAAETGVETVQNSPDVGAADTLAAVGSVTGSLTKQTVETAQNKPYQFAGEVVGGAALGTAAFKGIEKTGDISRSVSLTGTDTVDLSDITDEAGVRGDLPSFDTDPDAPTREAVEEIRTKASDNPDAVTEGTGGDSTLYHGTQAEFDADLEVGEGASELPGLFTSPEASPIALQGTGTGWPSPTLKPRLPSIGGKSDRFVGLPGDDVRGMPEDATGAGYAVKQGDDVVESGLGRGEAKARASSMDDAEVAPDPTTSGYEFLTENAEADAAYVRPEGGRTTELESIFPPESEFTKTGTVGVRVGRKQIPGTDVDIPGTGRKVPLDLFERTNSDAADSSPGPSLEELDAGETTTAVGVSRDLDRLGNAEGSVAAGGAYTGGVASAPDVISSADALDSGATESLSETAPNFISSPETFATAASDGSFSELTDSLTDDSSLVSIGETSTSTGSVTSVTGSTGSPGGSSGVPSGGSGSPPSDGGSPPPSDGESGPPSDGGSFPPSGGGSPPPSGGGSSPPGRGNTPTGSGSSPPIIPTSGTPTSPNRKVPLPDSNTGRDDRRRKDLDRNWDEIFENPTISPEEALNFDPLGE